MNLRHLSASAISAFEECPMAFYGRYHYRWEWVSPPMMAQALALGTAVHKALEAHHSGQDAIAALCTHWGTITTPMASDKFAKAVGLVHAYIADEAHDPRDIVERKFSLEIPGIPIPFIGYIDLQRGPLLFRDYKTTSSTTWWTQERVDADIQLTIYALFLSGECHGAQVTGEVHVLRHGEQFEHEVFTTTRNRAAQREGQDRIRAVWSGIQKGELNAICKPGRCRYPTRCREFGYVGTDSQELVVTGR